MTPSGYQIEIAESNGCCSGRIFCKGIRHFTEKIGFFLAKKELEDSTFHANICLEIVLRQDLKFDPTTKTTYRTSNPEGISGPDKALLEQIKIILASDLKPYSSTLISEIASLVAEVLGPDLPIGINVYHSTCPEFEEVGCLWKE